MSDDWLCLVGARLARLRWGLKLTTNVLSKRVHLTPQTLECLERGDCDFNVITFWKLSEALGALPYSLLEQSHSAAEYAPSKEDVCGSLIYSGRMYQGEDARKLPGADSR